MISLSELFSPLNYLNTPFILLIIGKRSSATPHIHPKEPEVREAGCHLILEGIVFQKLLSDRLGIFWLSCLCNRSPSLSVHPFCVRSGLALPVARSDLPRLATCVSKGKVVIPYSLSYEWPFCEHEISWLRWLQLATVNVFHDLLNSAL